MEQVLIRTDTAGFSVQDPGFGKTGLSQLQIWNLENGQRLFLCSVTDHDTAAEWLGMQQSLGHILIAEYLKTA